MATGRKSAAKGAPQPKGRFWWPHAAAAAAALVMVLMGWALSEAAQQIRRASGWVVHTQEVLESAARFNSRLSQAESAHRGFLLTGAERFAQERDAALMEAKAILEALSSATSDNAPQAEQLAEVARRLAERAEAMANADRVRRQEGLQAAVALVGAGRGQALSAAVLASMQRFRDRELELLRERETVLADVGSASRWVLAISFVVALLIVLPAYVGFVKAHKARQEIQARIVDLAENLPGAVFQFRRYPDGTARYEFVSEAASTERGIDARAAMADPSVVLGSILPEDLPGVMDAVAESARTLRLLEHDYRVTLPGGEVRWFRTEAKAKGQPDGSVLWTGLWSDVTDKREMTQLLRQSRDEAEAANRAKSVFLATMSHEIRTPMNGVLGMLELLSLTSLNTEQRRTLRVVQESGRSLVRIIDDILDFSKVEAGKLDLRPEPSSMAEVVRRIRDVFSGVAASKGLSLRESVDSAIAPALVMDASRIQQVLSNLVSNALKFTAEGSVDLRAQLVGAGRDSQHIRLSVADSGIGISDADQRKLFAPFVQVGGANSARMGTGLGLSIVRALVDLMGGTVSLESEPGRGTTVTIDVWLPVADGPAPQSDEVALLLENAAHTPRRHDDRSILVVDDHPINRMVIGRQVRELGYRAETADDGATAFEMWKSGRFSAILCDCNMPGMSGYDLARQIRAAEAAGTVRIPIIACTANALQGEATNCIEAGMDDYLPKPMSLATLSLKLRLWLDGASPPASPPSPVEPIDAAALAQASSPDSAVQREFLERFREFNAVDVDALQQAHRCGDLGSVLRAAHRIRGASKTVGATSLASICEDIERAARAEDPQELAQHMGRLPSELGRLEAWIAANASRG